MTPTKYRPYDKSGKRLIQHHGDSMLRLAKIDSILAWRPVQAEVVHPRQWPDGPLEARLAGGSRTICLCWKWPPILNAESASN